MSEQSQVIDEVYKRLVFLLKRDLEELDHALENDKIPLPVDAYTRIVVTKNLMESYLNKPEYLKSMISDLKENLEKEAQKILTNGVSESILITD